VGLELDETAQLISYEEFHPYGTTAYRAANSAVDVSPSRYRYTGQERDEETGLGHHGARYYASWLGRWTAADPIGLGDGVNRFAYAHDRPSTLIDPTGMAGQTPYDFSDEPLLVKGDGSAGRAGVGYKPTEALSTEGDPAFGGVSLAVDRPSIQRQQALRNAEALRGQIQLGNARPRGLPSNAAAIEQAGIVVGFVGDKPGSGGDIRQVYSIAGDPVGELTQGIEQDFTIELAALDLLAAKGVLGLGRAAFVAALERRAACDSSGGAALRRRRSGRACRRKHAGRLRGRAHRGRSQGRRIEGRSGGCCRSRGVRRKGGSVRSLEIRRHVEGDDPRDSGIGSGFQGETGTTATFRPHTDLQRRALEENMRLVINRTIPAVKAGAGKQSLRQPACEPKIPISRSSTRGSRRAGAGVARHGRSDPRTLIRRWSDEA
jgi:RHS repeat-associated protein